MEAKPEVKPAEAVVIMDSPPAYTVNNEQSVSWTTGCVTISVTGIVIKVIILVMLIACFGSSAAVLEFNNSISPEADNEMYWTAALPGNLTALWTMIVSFIAIVINFVCVPLHIIISATRFCRINDIDTVLNIFGGLDIIQYTVLGIAILLALIGYASTRQDVENFIDECEKDYPGDPGCDELRELYDNFLAPLVITGITLVVIIAGGIWAIFYLVTSAYTNTPRTVTQVNFVQNQ